jgi:hypothetical protein
MRDSTFITRFAPILALAAGTGRVSAQAPATPASRGDFHLLETTIEDIHAALQSKRITCRELVGLYLKRIEAYDKTGPHLNAVQTVSSHALQEAERLDAAYASSGPVGPLHCIPVLLKDQVETSDMPTTYGSMIFKEFVPRQDATITTKMKKARAVILAKTNMGEFAAGYVGSAFGIARNAYSAQPFRFIERNGLGHRGQLRHRGYRGRYGRVGARSSCSQQPGGIATDCAAGEPVRHDAGDAQPGHPGADRAHGEGRSPVARRDCRL